MFYGFGIYDSDGSEEGRDSEDSSDDEAGGKAMEINLMTNQNYFSNSNYNSNSAAMGGSRFAFARAQPLPQFGGNPGLGYGG